MKQLRHTPLFKLALFMIAGILLAEPAGLLLLGLGLVAALLFAGSMLCDRRLLGPAYDYLQAIFIYMVALGMGVAWQWVYNWQRTPGIAYVNCRKVQLEGMVLGKVKQTPYGQKAWLEARQVYIDEKAYAIQGRLLLYVRPEAQLGLEAHQHIRLWGHITNVRSKYPAYLQYLHQNQIEYACYTDSLQLLGIQRSMAWYAAQVQGWYARRIEALIPSAEIAGIAKAMFVGDKADLKPESRETFAAVGASHILAISGLHVGIIYLLLSWLFRPLHLLRHGKRMKSILILILLLMYMGITGATPAVIRAVLMFAAILLFDIWYQRYHILNVLAISAFAQIFWDPTIAFSISFQLSYCAVAGIVILFPLFEKQFPTKNVLLKKLYSCIGVTLCATLATTPLVLLYFGQFPTYFLLTNLLIALLTAGIVFAGFLMVLFIWIPGFNEICGYACYLLLSGLNELCHCIASWPHAVIKSAGFDEPGLYILGLELTLAWGVLMLPRWWKLFSRQVNRLNPQKAPPKLVSQAYKP